MKSARTTTTATHRQQQIAERYLRGAYQTEIARELGIDQSQVSRDLKAIRGLWLASAIRDFDAAKAEELARVDAVERAAWAAWERSQSDKEASFEEQVDDPIPYTDSEGKPQTTTKTRKKTSLRREGQSGNPAFLHIILECVERRCKILGLDAPQRFIIEDWDALTPEQLDRLAAGEPPEKVLAA